eukprot:9982_1
MKRFIFLMTLVTTNVHVASSAAAHQSFGDALLLTFRWVHALRRAIMFFAGGGNDVFRFIISYTKEQVDTSEAYHSCDHTAKRSGLKKTTLLTGSSASTYHRVFCSHKAYVTKMSANVTINDHGKFVSWKRQTGEGQTVFACPYYMDEQTCRGSECHKRCLKRTKGGTINPMSSK